jgi:hypothetical protein
MQTNQKVTMYEFKKKDFDLPARHKWLMTAGIDDNETVYAPCTDKLAGILAMCDGIPYLLESQDHLYLPVDWQIEYFTEVLRCVKGKEAGKIKELVSVALPNIKNETLAAHKSGKSC